MFSGVISVAAVAKAKDARKHTANQPTRLVQLDATHPEPDRHRRGLRKSVKCWVKRSFGSFCGTGRYHSEPVEKNEGRGSIEFHLGEVIIESTGFRSESSSA